VLLQLQTLKKVFHFLFFQFEMNSVNVLEKNNKFHAASNEHIHPASKTPMLSKNPSEILMHAFCTTASYKNPASAPLSLKEGCQCNSADRSVDVGVG
jgi:hypothetical protein